MIEIIEYLIAEIILQLLRLLNSGILVGVPPSSSRGPAGKCSDPHVELELSLLCLGLSDLTGVLRGEKRRSTNRATRRNIIVLLNLLENPFRDTSHSKDVAAAKLYRCFNSLISERIFVANMTGVVLELGRFRESAIGDELIQYS